MIELQFVFGRNLGAQLIEWFGHGVPVSHVDIVLPDDKGLLGSRLDHVNGIEPGVQIRPLDYMGQEKTFRVSIPIDQIRAENFHAWALKQLGKPYDVSGIAGFIACRDWQKPDQWFCSELVAAGLIQCGYFQYPLALPACKVTPANLLLMLSVNEMINLDACGVPA